jgi:hypothetical protein
MISRRNTPPHVRVEYLTNTLAAAWDRYQERPSDRARRTMSLVATERMRAQLPPPGPDLVELEVAAMFPDPPIRAAEEMPATRRAIELRTALASALLEDNPDPIGPGGWE